MQTFEVVKTMQNVLHDVSVDDCLNIIWELAASHPETFMEVVNKVAPNAVPVSLVEQVRRLAATFGHAGSSNKIDHIKAYRTLTHAGLHESKEWVETTFPEFRSRW